jgi:hypothetical protein
MTSAINEQHRPVWALTSLAVPVVGLILGFWVLSLPEPHGGHPAGLLRISQFGAILPLSFFVGHCAAIGALIRGERSRKLAWAGLLLSGIPFVVYLAALLFVNAGR